MAFETRVNTLLRRVCRGGRALSGGLGPEGGAVWPQKRQVRRCRPELDRKTMSGSSPAAAGFRAQKQKSRRRTHLDEPSSDHSHTSSRSPPLVLPLNEGWPPMSHLGDAAGQFFSDSETGRRRLCRSAAGSDAPGVGVGAGGVHKQETRRSLKTQTRWVFSTAQMRNEV